MFWKVTKLWCSPQIMNDNGTLCSFLIKQPWNISCLHIWQGTVFLPSSLSQITYANIKFSIFSCGQTSENNFITQETSIIQGLQNPRLDKMSNSVIYVMGDPPGCFRIQVAVLNYIYVIVIMTNTARDGILFEQEFTNSVRHQYLGAARRKSSHSEI